MTYTSCKNNDRFGKVRHLTAPCRNSPIPYSEVFRGTHLFSGSSSIHQAKGLEWKVVFLIWLVDGQFPNGRILEADDKAAFEEERRLFYVALTRAKDELYLTYPMLNPTSNTGDVLCRPSRFLNDFPKEMVEEWNVGNEWAEDDPF